MRGHTSRDLLSSVLRPQDMLLIFVSDASPASPYFMDMKAKT